MIIFYFLFFSLNILEDSYIKNDSIFKNNFLILKMNQSIKSIKVKEISNKDILFNLIDYKNFFIKRVIVGDCPSKIIVEINKNSLRDGLCEYKYIKGEVDISQIQEFIKIYGKKNLLLLKNKSFYYAKTRKFIKNILNKKFYEKINYDIFLDKNKKLLFYKENIFIHNIKPLYSKKIWKLWKKDKKLAISYLKIKNLINLFVDILGIRQYLSLFFVNQICPKCHFLIEDIQKYDNDSFYLLQEILKPKEILNRYQYFDSYYFEKIFESVENGFNVKNNFKIVIKKDDNHILFFHWEKTFTRN